LKVDRIALVRLDALGDSLLTTPALCMLRRLLPQAEILCLAHSAGAAVLRPLCQVAEVSPSDTWKTLGKVLREFQAEVVLCCSEKRRAALATWDSGATLRVGFQPGWKQPLKALASQMFFHKMAPANPPHLHETERYASLVELALGPSGLEVPPLQLQPEARHYESARAFYSSLSRFRQDRPDWQLVGPAKPFEDPLAGRGKRADESPVGLGVQLTPKWCRFGYTVLHLRRWLEALAEPWLGLVGPAEEEWARRHFPDTPLYCSRDIFEYAAVLEGLQALITVDTGAAHVAAARRVPLVDVFPEENQAHCVPRWRPWRCPHQVVLQPAFSPQAADAMGEELRAALSRLRNSSGGGAD